jgi:hypothetical protein
VIVFPVGGLGPSPQAQEAISITKSKSVFVRIFEASFIRFSSAANKREQAPRVDPWDVELRVDQLGTGPEAPRHRSSNRHRAGPRGASLGFAAHRP